MAMTAKANLWGLRVVTLIIWALAFGSATYWGLRLTASGSAATLQPPAAGKPEPVADSAAVSRLLGSTVIVNAVAAPVASKRFVLLGVVADRSSRGAALIAIDGKAGKPYRVGSQVDDNWVLDSVEPRRARLKPVTGVGAEVFLEMPALKQP